MEINNYIANNIGIAVNKFTDWYDRKTCVATMIMINKLTEEEVAIKSEELDGDIEKAIAFADSIITDEERKMINEAIEYYGSVGFVVRNFFETLGDNFTQENLEEIMKNIKE